MEYDPQVILGRNDISENSKQAYCYAMKRILKLDPTKDLVWYISHAQKTHKLLISKIPEIKTRVATICGLMAYMRYSGVKEKKEKTFEAWKKIYNPYLHKLNVEAGSNQPTEKQKEAFVDWEVIVKKRDELGGMDYAGKEHMLLSMYTMIPPRRQLDYYKVKMFTKPHKLSAEELAKLPAYLQLFESPEKLVVNEFKTSKAYSAWSKEIPADLLKVIKKSIKLHPRDYLFVQKDGSPFSNGNSFQKFTNRILKSLFDNPKISINTLRHSYRTSRNGVATLNEMKREAHDMGHSLETHLKYTFIEKETKSSA